MNDLIREIIHGIGHRTPVAAHGTLIAAGKISDFRMDLSRKLRVTTTHLFNCRRLRHFWFPLSYRPLSLAPSPYPAFIELYQPEICTNSGADASIWATISSSIKCFSEIAPVGHFELQRPSPLHIAGITRAFFPCGVSWNSIAL